MKRTFSVSYFRGPNPMPIEAEIYLGDDFLRIQFKSEQNLMSSTWKVKGIIPDQDGGDGRLILQYKDNHINEFIESTDLDFLQALQSSYPEKKFIKSNGYGNKRIAGILSLSVIAFLAAIIGAYFLMVPKISMTMAKNVPLEWETKLGDQLFQQSASEMEIDTLKSAFLDSFLIELNFSSTYDIRPHYVNENTVNAFAMPGGNIVVFSGIISKMTDYTQLAALLGHEFIHVEHKHSLQSIFRAMSSYMLVSIVFGDLTGIAAVLTDNANAVMNLSYSREFEEDADKTAFHLMKEKGIDSQGLISLFSLLKESHTEGSDIPKFLSTHPLTDDRLEAIRKLQQEHYYAAVNHEKLSYYFEKLRN